MATTSEEQKVKDVLQEIKELRANIKRIEKLPEDHPERARLPGLDLQLAELLKKENNLQTPGASEIIGIIMVALSDLLNDCCNSNTILCTFNASHLTALVLIHHPF